MSTTRINAKATPINDNDYSCHITAIELFNQSYEVHITPLVINSLGRGHTHTHTHTRTHIPSIRTGSILRNQVCAGLWPAHAWFKNILWGPRRLSFHFEQVPFRLMLTLLRYRRDDQTDRQTDGFSAFILMYCIIIINVTVTWQVHYETSKNIQ